MPLQQQRPSDIVPGIPVDMISQQKWQQHTSGSTLVGDMPSQQQLQKQAFLHSVGDRWDAPFLDSLLNSESGPLIC